MGVGEVDERYYTFTFYGEEGKVEDPTRAFQVYGLPGSAGAYALEMIWKESKDSRFHPMNQRCVKQFWLSTCLAIPPLTIALPPLTPSVAQMVSSQLLAVNIGCGFEFSTQDLELGPLCHTRFALTLPYAPFPLSLLIKFISNFTAQRLWPPTSKISTGRPREKPFKKGGGHKHLRAFESRPHNMVKMIFFSICDLCHFYLQPRTV